MTLVIYQLLLATIAILENYVLKPVPGGHGHQPSAISQIISGVSGNDLFWINIFIGICAAYILYTLFILKSLEQRAYNWPHALALTLAGITIAAATQHSSNFHTIHHIAFIIFMFFVAIGGAVPVVMTAVTALSAMVVTMFIVPQHYSSAHAYEMLFILVGVAVGFLGWFIFKRWYEPSSNIKELEEVSDRLSRERSAASTIIESITDGVIIISAEGVAQVVNESAAHMLGWLQKDAVNLDYHSLLVPIPEVGIEKSDGSDRITAVDVCLQTAKRAQSVSFLQTVNDRRIYVDIVASPIYSKAPKQDQASDDTPTLVGVIAVLRDVDDQKREEKQRSDFISTASHEMRTPVAAIQGYIDLARNPKVCTVDDKAKNYLNKAHEATEHLGRLFQDLLTVSKSEDGRIEMRPEVIEVDDLIQKTVDMLQQKAKAKNLTLIMPQVSQSDIKPLMHVYVDKIRLQEVLTNLIDNAIKYTAHGGVRVSATANEDTVLIAVTDSGIGIATEDIPHLFQKFYRTDNTATREIGGTGLGLYITRQLVTQMNGRVWAQSTVGKGSTFFISLPRANADFVKNSFINQKP